MPMSPDEQEWFNQLFQGNPEMMPQGGGPPGTGGLEGGWEHIPTDPMAFIRELLTPQNVQRTTQFAGGSHYGPDREKSIPAQNFAQAEQLSKQMAMQDNTERTMAAGKMADDAVRQRVEAERTNLSPGWTDPKTGKAQPGSMTFGGETAIVPGKIGVQVPMGEGERGLMAAAGYNDGTTGYSRGSSSGGKTADPGPDFGDVTKRLEFMAGEIRKDEVRLGMMSPGDPGYAELADRIKKGRADVDSLQSGGRGGGVETVDQNAPEAEAPPSATGGIANPGQGGIGAVGGLFGLGDNFQQHPTFGDAMMEMSRNSEEAPAEKAIRQIFGGQIPEGVDPWKFVLQKLTGDQARSASSMLAQSGPR